jgi:transcriptional regulator with XRE-family HTH domain
MHELEQAPVGQLLQSLRTERGWSLREVERRSDGLLRSSHLSQIETGRVQEPSLSVLRLLASVFGMSFADLLARLDVLEDREPALDSDEALVLSFYSDIAPERRDEARDYLKWLAQAPARKG